MAYDADLAAQQSIYTPEAAKKVQAQRPPVQTGKARTTVLRKGGGEVWEDPSLMEWDPGERRRLEGERASIVLTSCLSHYYSSFPIVHR